MDYDKTFAEMLDFMEFALDRDELGYFLVDLTGVYLGDIGSDRFDTAEQIIDRMGVYINDYMLDDDEWGSFSSCEEALAECPEHPLSEYLDLIVNHISEVDLNKVVKPLTSI